MATEVSKFRGSALCRFRNTHRGDREPCSRSAWFARAVHFTDGADERFRLFELNIFGAMAREDLFGIRRKLKPLRLCRTPFGAPHGCMDEQKRRMLQRAAI